MNNEIDSFGCVENTIKVHSGWYFDLVNPTPEMVDLESIAHALSMTCRFGGHIPRFYSVAEHCIHAASLTTDQWEACVLMHDAAEAYVGDMVKPLKQIIPKFQHAEWQVECAIKERLKVDWNEDEIKRCDRLMLKAEKLFFWPDDSEQWQGFAGIETPDVDILCYGPEEAERRFLEACWRLELI